MRPKQAQAVEEYDNCSTLMADNANCAVLGQLCVSQGAADDPNVRNHHRGHAEYNQVFHFVISLFDW